MQARRNKKVRMSVDLAIVYSPVGGGHKAAALALAETARGRGVSAEVLDLFEFAPAIVGSTYVATHLNWTGAAPDLYGRAYHGSNYRGGAFEPLRLKFDQLLFGALLRRIDELGPRAIVATHHLPLVVLGRAREKGRVLAPVTAVITDYTSHAVWAERGVDAFCVPSLFAHADIVRHRDDARSVFLTGIPVREAFERIAPVSSPRAGEPLRVLCTSGGFGVGPMRRIVRSFAGVPGIELTVVCGAARSLVAEVERDAAEIGLRARVIGFERDMPARLAEAHVVVGKAGGLTVSETLTAGRPMIVVGAVPGNEKHNEAFVVGGGAGVASEPEDVGRVAHALWSQQGLVEMGARWRMLVVSRAAERVLGVAMGQTRRQAFAA